MFQQYLRACFKPLICSSTSLSQTAVLCYTSTQCRAAQDSGSSEAIGTGNMWKQSHAMSSDQSWSKVDRKKGRRNKGLLSQPDRHLSHFQPMPQSLQNDDEFNPASAPHDWPIRSEGSCWSPSEASLPPVTCPVQEVATALQFPGHENLLEGAAQSAPPDEQVQLLPSELEKMSFQHNRAMYTQSNSMARPFYGPQTYQPQMHSSTGCNPSDPPAELQQQPNSNIPPQEMVHRHSFHSMPSQQSYAPASAAATAGHWNAGLKAGQGSSALSSGVSATQPTASPCCF